MRPVIFLLAALACIAPARAETGLASWYGSREEGRPMANGRPFHANSDNAASRTYPLGTHLLVTNLANGRHANVTIEDRGPYVRPRIIDLSHGTAKILGFKDAGVAMVRIEPAKFVRPIAHCHRERVQRRVKRHVKRHAR